MLCKILILKKRQQQSLIEHYGVSTPILNPDIKKRFRKQKLKNMDMNILKMECYQ